MSDAEHLIENAICDYEENGSFDRFLACSVNKTMADAIGIRLEIVTETRWHTMFYTPSSRIGQNIMRIELLDTYGILRIKTTEFLFDLEDLPLIKGRDSWYCDKDGYLVSSYFYNGVRRFVRFHRLVMHAKPGQCVDHINKNKADNRKKNLRCCERSENDRNRSLYSCNTSGVAGVYFDKQRKKWVASITYNHKKVYLGRYAVKEEAILARLTKEVELYKEFSPQRELLESLNL